MVKNIRQDLERIDRILGNIDKTTEQAPEIMQGLQAGIQDVRKILADVEKGSTDVPEVTRAAKQGIGEARDSLKNVDGVVQSIKKNPFIRLKYSPGTDGGKYRCGFKKIGGVMEVPLRRFSGALGVCMVFVLTLSCTADLPRTAPVHLSAGAEQIKKGNNLYQKGCYKGALEHFFRAHELYAVSDQQSGIAMSMNNIGSVYRALGDASGALVFFEEAAPPLRKRGR